MTRPLTSHAPASHRPELVVACVLVAMAALVACGNDADQPSAESDATDSTTTTATAVPSSTDVPATTVFLGDPFEFATYWERGVDDPRPVDMYLYTDDPSEPRPYLLFGSVTNRGAAPVTGVTVHGTWVDASGAVVYEADTEAELSGRTELEPGAAADWLFVIPPDGTPKLDGLEVQLSGTAA